MGKSPPHKCPLIDEWIKQILEYSPMKYYSATEENELGIHETTWMDLDRHCIEQKKL